jgi:protein-disulfide isomerase
VKKEYWIAIVVAALVVVGVVVGVSLAGGGDDGDAPSSIEGVAEVKAVFEGIPASGNVLGDPDAPVQIIEYGDLACPACRQASAEVIPDILESIVRPGEAQLVFRPVAFISRSSERGALGAEAAAMQDAIWPFTSLIYRNQGPESDQDWLTDELMEEAVADLGLDVEKWKSDYAGTASEEAFLTSQSQAEADQLSSTPLFVIEGPGGKKQLQSFDVADFEAAVAEVGPQT